ncbi:TetR/AcrR family transcriptional regulator [Tritonibacter scottomollicae]|uniref:TetR family transcriptional regulator n=1 Tax=Tritonibacter scottomollicae TaxID=483013 RepID=A0A2T1ABL6_TRISK|nr:TetR/AcrR family transcriptional regulator [Tritonibacter scottomollicae]PRZ45990.1 TetR family transcriptional regulator [Tritonibacter scottomollicae]WOI34578.1 TetR/AcrR family transcriptional regulator [Tritonibacter scottomollicae]
MTTKAEQRRADLRDKLVVAAEARIRETGVTALRARDLAKDAGCAVGAIYNAFDDMTALVMAVNGRTFQRLGAVVEASITASRGASATDRLILMSEAYLDFASDNSRLWRALFDLELPADGAVPVWYRTALDRLFQHIAGPVAELFPDQPPEEQALTVRALFSSVHGIVLLGLENRISGVPPQDIRRMIALVLSRLMVR